MSKWDCVFEAAGFLLGPSMMVRAATKLQNGEDFRIATFTAGDLTLQVFSYDDGFTLAELHKSRALVYSCTGATLDQAMERVEARMVERSAK